MNVPGSPSSALQTTYFCSPGDLAANSHFRLVGKPAPPRPRSPEASTLRKASAGGRASAARSPLPASMVLNVS